MTSTILLQSHKKRRIALRHWLLGRGYTHAARSMAFNERLFSGLRKDGITPAFDHHISQAQYARTLPALLFHDTMEDWDLAPSEVLAQFLSDQDFGKRVTDAAWRMTKKWRGEKRNEKELFAEMGRCPIASIAKGCDRIHNVQSMVGVFTEAKQRQYIEEVHELFLPMLKEASYNFPEQEPAYQNIRMLLRSQCALIRAGLDGTHVAGT
jgi:(p)ppGpp synthase/HD superfamily hydrolase